MNKEENVVGNETPPGEHFYGKEVDTGQDCHVRGDEILPGRRLGSLRCGRDAVSAFVRACKAVGRKWVYASKDLLRLELIGRRIIHDLMDVFWEGACFGSQDLKPKTYPGKAYRLVSANYRHVLEDELQHRHSDRTKELSSNVLASHNHLYDPLESR